MTNLVIPEPKKTLIPVHGSDEFFPVRRVYCIGRNYAAHTIEMGFDPDKEPPFFFQKTLIILILLVNFLTHLSLAMCTMS